MATQVGHSAWSCKVDKSKADHAAGHFGHNNINNHIILTINDYDHHYHHIGLKFEIRQTQQSISTATNSQHRSRSLEAFLDDCFIIDQNHVFWVSIYLLLGRSSYYQNQSFIQLLSSSSFHLYFLYIFAYYRLLGY
ncbi:hypothetical protein DERF_010408 [Dermatophagoides farinae]|uniref:Uncharacterized protein n=1 Tax=Dermatophagoides farinae TaxID=6954 RepID=A0A922L4Z8_DERFA|nr:hypothetical protein DERF_010408 [Dermatophagoides farinae]